MVPGLHCCDLQYVLHTALSEENITLLQECMKPNTLNLRVRNGCQMEDCRIEFPCYNTAYNFICSFTLLYWYILERVISLW